MPTAAYLSLPESLDCMAAEWKWTVPYVEFPRQGDILADAVRQGSALAVADGSFKNNRGTSGFCITTADQKQVFRGANDVPGDDIHDHCSYRSELTGILGLLVLCRSMCQTYRIQDGDLTIGCDNLESGKHALEFNDTPRPTDNHFDLLHAIHQIRKEIPLRLHYKHVEGHQKEKYPSRQLDLWARLNDKMDALAKAYWLAVEHQPRLQGICLMPNEWRATLDGIRVCRQFKKNFRRRIEGRLLEEKWVSLGRGKRRRSAPLFSRQQIQHMDFTSIQSAWDSIPGHRRRFVSKLASSYMPVGRYMKRMKFWAKDNCPCCLGRNETVFHMLSECPDPRMIAIRHSAINQFSTHLSTIRTDSSIHKTILAMVRQAMMGSPRIPQDEAPSLRPAIASQLLIGRQHLLFGRLSTHWADIQHKAYSHYAPWLTGTTWAKKVVQGIWSMTFTIWEQRNQILHSTDVHDDLIDMDSIDLQIIEEWHNGYEQLSSLDLHLYKGLSLDELLGKRSHYRREWLAAVRLARDPGDPDLEEKDIQELFDVTQLDLHNHNPTIQNPNSFTPTSLPDESGEASDNSSSDSSSSTDE